LDDHLQLDKYLRLGKNHDYYISITLNEMYFIHSLLKGYSDVLNPGDKLLREILTELGPAPPQLPRKDNANVELLLINRYKGNENSETKEMKPEQIYTETKYLLFTIIKAVPPAISAKTEK